MTTEEIKAVEEAAKKHELFSSIRGDKYSFVKGAEFLSILRKPSEESIMLAKRIICTMDDWMQFDENDVLENLEEVATEIAKLLQPDMNIGKHNAVTSEQIAKGIKLYCGEKVDGPRIRKIINYIRLNGLVPGLMATSDGYYIATKPEELDEYIESLKGRITAISAVYSSIKKQKELMFPKREATLFQNA